MDLPLASRSFLRVPSKNFLGTYLLLGGFKTRYLHYKCPKTWHLSIHNLTQDCLLLMVYCITLLQILIFKEKFYKFREGVFFSWNRMVEVTSPKIGINFSWTYKKLHCKGEKIGPAISFDTNTQKNMGLKLNKKK